MYLVIGDGAHRPMAESKHLKCFQCGFESHCAHSAVRSDFNAVIASRRHYDILVIGEAYLHLYAI